MNPTKETVNLGTVTKSFNSLYLGFLHESLFVVTQANGGIMPLSIPSTWDFSMNHKLALQSRNREGSFQFPLLGISP